MPGTQTNIRKRPSPGGRVRRDGLRRRCGGPCAYRAAGRGDAAGRKRAEIACGTGLWTQALAGWADTVMAIDAAPEMVAIARDRVRSARVSFEVADVFSWDPGTRSTWSSSRRGSRMCRRAGSGSSGSCWEDCWPGNGRVLFVDEHVDERGKEGLCRGLG